MSVRGSVSVHKPITSQAEKPEYFAVRSCCGVRIALQANTSALLEAVTGLIPGPPCHSEDAARVFLSIREDRQTGGAVLHEIAVNGTRLQTGLAFDEALRFIEQNLQEAVALLAEDLILVHAAAVAWNGRAILLPGASGTGKSSLAMGLVEAGATYYSDEYAVIDLDARVHPYLRAPRLRSPAGRETASRLADRLAAGMEPPHPVPVGLILVSRYSDDATWEPRALSCRETLFELLENTVAVRYKPELSLKVLKGVSLCARSFQSPRGDASGVVSEVLRV